MVPIPLQGAHRAAVRFGRPGVLYVALLGSPEPTSASSAVDAAYVRLGYTSTGSNFQTAVSAGNVEVAEEIDILARVVESRDVTVEFSLAETTLRNLQLLYNGGVLQTPTGAAWKFDLPDLGNETHVMLMWDALPVTANNDLRILWRDMLQTGNIGSEQRKGTQKSEFSATFSAGIPDTGLPVASYWGHSRYNTV